MAITSVGRAVVLSTFDTNHGDVVVGTMRRAPLAGLPLLAVVVAIAGRGGG